MTLIITISSTQQPILLLAQVVILPVRLAGEVKPQIARVASHLGQCQIQLMEPALPAPLHNIGMNQHHLVKTVLRAAPLVLMLRLAQPVKRTLPYSLQIATVSQRMGTGWMTQSRLPSARHVPKVAVLVPTHRPVQPAKIIIL